MKFYIATRLENHAEHNRLRDLLKERGHEITYDWTEHGAVHSKGLARIREVAELETQGVLDADAVIVLWPGGRGTHVELGIALGSEKRHFIIHFVSAVEPHHVATSETCAFYHHPSVIRHRSVTELLECFPWL